jgi:Flp pilus assembly pilin Flp
MSRVETAIERYLRSQSGAVAVEYGMIVAALALAIYPAFHLITSGVQVRFQDIVNAFNFFG